MLREPTLIQTPAGHQWSATASSAMTASAAVSCALDHRGHNRLTQLRSEGQLVLRPTQAKGFEPWAQSQADIARVSISSGTAGPLGGDRLHLDVTVAAGASLVLNEISATLALPGARGGQSVMTIDVDLGEGATLIWLPEPVIAAAGCDHRQQARLRMAAGARCFVREELIVGRYNEQPGNLAQRLRITETSGVLYDQEFRLGPAYSGWDGPAVADDAICLGSTIVVDPESKIGTGVSDTGLRADVIGDSTVLMGLSPDSVQISSVGTDNLAVGSSTQQALQMLGEPWAPG